MKSKVVHLLLFAGLASVPAEAGMLLAPQLNYAAYTFRPLDGEVTPNYFAYGAGMTAGYSAAQVFDLAVQAFYYPSRLGNAKPLKEDAALFSYGGEIAIRFSSTVYLGLRGGTYVYNLLRMTRDEETDGRWTGPGGGIAIGGILMNKNDRAIQVSLEAETTVVKRIDDDAPEDSPTRKIDMIKFCLTYVYNGINKIPMFDTFVGELF